MFSVEYKEEGSDPDVIEIYVTREEAKELANDLLSLAETLSDNRSLGYFSKAWGGEDLRDEPVCEGQKTAKGLRVYLADELMK